MVKFGNEIHNDPWLYVYGYTSTKMKVHASSLTIFREKNVERQLKCGNIQPYLQTLILGFFKIYVSHLKILKIK